MRWKLPEKWKLALGTYKYLILTVLVGSLLLLPGGSRTQNRQETQPKQPPAFDLKEVEHRLESALSQISGAGKVRVVLTVKENGRQVYAQDVTTDQREQVRRTVVVSRGNGLEEAVAVQSFSPTFQGALVVCPGGADPKVKLQITQAICALTGLSAEKVSVCQSER